MPKQEAVRLKRPNLCDVFGQKAKYVAFKKEGKTLIIQNPDDKEIRRKSKKKWTLIGWVAEKDNGTALLKLLAKHYKTECAC
jgi:hypothetical protein